jgi:hypothetical protein
MSRRARFLLVLLVSVGLHAVLLLALSRVPSRSLRLAPPHEAIELEILTRKPPPSEPAPPRPGARGPAVSSSAKRGPKPSVPQAAPGPEAKRPEAPPPVSDAPLAAQAPRLDLEPRKLPGGDFPVAPPSTGRTLRNTPGSTPDPQALLAEEEARVSERVEGWAKGAAAEARASGGAVSPYFAKLRQGFSARLVNPPPPDAKVVIARLKREQLETLERFGRTGTPDAPKERDIRAENADRFRAAVEAGRAANMFMNDVTAPVLALAAVVEVRQARDGRLVELKVLEGSGDPTFDAWAVVQLRDALARADPPPDEGMGIHEDGMWTRWRLEEYLGNPRVRIRLLAVY